MEYLKLGKSELNVSRIALGTWAIGGSNWDNYNEEQAKKAIEVSVDMGINFIDTAPAYGGGRAEELIGEIIKDKRDRIIIASKCGLDIKNRYKKNLSPEFIERDLSASLKRLGTDYIDLYQCHWPVNDTPVEETMKAMLKFQEQGKIRYIGLSNFSGKEIMECLKYADIISMQPQYSLLERGIEKDIQKLCVENNIALIAYGSLGAGLLTGKYSELPRFSRLDARSFFYPFFQEEHWKGVKTLVDGLSKIARDKKVKPSHVAIAWLLSRKGVVSAIAGARTPEQAYENSRVNVVLSSEEIEILDTLSENVYIQGQKIH